MELTAYAVPARRETKSVAFETLVDFVSNIALICGITVALILLVYTKMSGWLVSMAMVPSTLLNWLLLRCLAEHLRLQKKIAGLDYAGRISGSYAADVLVCSNCDSVLKSDVYCLECGARLIKPPEDTGSSEG